MKKKILFVIYGELNIGGVEKSLISLLNELDYTKYDVDLILFKNQGMLIQSLPKEVNLIPQIDILKYALLPKYGIIKVLKDATLKYDARLTMKMVKSIMIGLSGKKFSIARQNLWKEMLEYIPSLEKEYDVAIGYSGHNSVNYVVDKVKSKKKIGWIHTDYRKSGRSKELDLEYFNRLDKIITVSDECKKILDDIFEELNNIEVINNIISIKLIKSMSEDKKDYMSENIDNNKIKLLTVSRLDDNKGFDIAIPACKKLISNGYNIQWIVLGDGPSKNKINDMIKKYELEDSFKLLGNVMNPYVYMQECYSIVHPSRFEGKSLTIDEAKLLCKPIVITNYPTVRDQIIHGYNGIITELNPDSLYEGITKMIDDNKLRLNLVENLKKDTNNISDSYHQICNILNE